MGQGSRWPLGLCPSYPRSEPRCLLCVRVALLAGRFRHRSARRRLFASAALLGAMNVLHGCGADSTSELPTPGATSSWSPVEVLGVPVDEGVFDPAPTDDSSGTTWMSYSYVSAPTSTVPRTVETRLAITQDGGLRWHDMGLTLNAATPLPLPPPNDRNAAVHEVSRLLYNTEALAAGSDPWLLLWHRYLSVLVGTESTRQFQHGWIGMKSGPTATTLGAERKLFTGAGYDPANNSDALGAPEYPLDQLYPDTLGDCAAFTEPGVLTKPEGVYVSLVCAKTTPPGDIVLLRCDHQLHGCVLLGVLLSGAEASALTPTFDNFSASELVTSRGADYLLATPTSSVGGHRYRGCVAYPVNLPGAQVHRDAGEVPVPSLVLGPHGDFNGACGYSAGLTASGVLMGEAFFTEQPIFRVYATGAHP